MSADDLARFDESLSRYLDDTLTDGDAAELAAWLDEPSLAARFLEMTRLDSEIAGVLAAPVPDEAMVELVRADMLRRGNETPVRFAENAAAASIASGLETAVIVWEATVNGAKTILLDRVR